MKFKIGDRIVLTEEGKHKYPKLAKKTGTVTQILKMIDGWMSVQFKGKKKIRSFDQKWFLLEGEGNGS